MFGFLGRDCLQADMLQIGGQPYQEKPGNPAWLGSEKAKYSY